MSVTDSPYGITLFVPTNNPPALSVQTMSDLLGWSSGAWLRYQVTWSAIEQTQGVYSWAFLDAAVSLCNSNGINLCLPLQNAPSWYKTIRATDGATVAAGTGDLPAAQAVHDFAVAVASRYNGTAGHGTIAALQIGNEEWDIFPNPDPTNLRDIQSKWLVAVVNAAYPAIKAVHPACRVGINAVRGTSESNDTHTTTWLTNLYTYNGGIGGNADWLDMHVYRGGSFNPDPVTGNSTQATIAQHLSNMLSVPASYGHTPEVWCAEFGYDLYDDGNGPTTTTTTSITAGSPLTALAVAASPSISNGEPLTIDYASGNQEVVYGYGSTAKNATSIAITTNAAGSGASQAAWTPAHSHASGVTVYAFSAFKTVYTPAQVEFWIWEWLEALRRGGAAKGFLYTMSPTATVTTTVTPNKTGNTKSITQTINGVYTHLLPYSDPATGQGIKEYAALYPLWPLHVALFAATRRRGGSFPSTTRRGGGFAPTKRRGGQSPAGVRRGGGFPSDKRRSGGFSTTKRRQS